VAGSTADAAVKAKPLRRAGALAGILAGPFFLVSVGLNTWASLGYLHQLGWEFVGSEQVPWPSSLTHGPYGWAHVATFAITGLLIVVLAIAVRNQLPHRRASSFAVSLLGIALIPTAFMDDTAMLKGGNSDTWHGWIHGIVPVDHRDGRAGTARAGSAVRGDRSWRPIASYPRARAPSPSSCSGLGGLRILMAIALCSAGS
jgi:hypothetical protein